MMIKVAHVITRLIVGGAQENTIATVLGLADMERFAPTLMTGPPLGPEGSLMETGWRDKVGSVLVPEMRRAINPFYDTITFLRLRAIFRREKYEIVHTHSSKAGIIARWAARLAGVPVIVHTIHGLPFHPYQPEAANLFYICLEKVAARVTDRIVTVADAMAEKAAAAGVAPRDKFTTIHSGMDLDSFLEAKKDRARVRDELGIAEDELVVGKIARLFHLKGHKYLFRAAKEIVRRVPRVRFLLVGDGILKGRFERQLEEMGIFEHFIFTGLVPPEMVSRMISAMDVVVHASLREGLARVLPQAMAEGVPVVSFDIDGACDIVRDGSNGFLVEAEDVAGLEKALLALLDDEELRKRLGENGRKTVDPIFREEYMVEKIASLYDELLDKKGITGK